MTTLLFAGLVAAASSSDAGKAPALALIIVLALAAACVFLFRSMSKQLKKVPASFDEPHLPEPADPADDAVALAEQQRRERQSDQG